jgi:hypothetical protein
MLNPERTKLAVEKINTLSGLLCRFTKISFEELISKMN